MAETMNAEAQSARACTCHPDDNPPVPCVQKFALSECKAAQGVTDEMVMRAVDAFWSKEGRENEDLTSRMRAAIDAALSEGGE